MMSIWDCFTSPQKGNLSTCGNPQDILTTRGSQKMGEQLPEWPSAELAPGQSLVGGQVNKHGQQSANEGQSTRGSQICNGPGAIM